MRAAIYYAPESDDPLWLAGSAWLGRDAETGAILRQPRPDLAAITRSPSRYGLHATLKPPMALAQGLPALREDLARLAARLAPCPMPPLRVGMIGPCLALLPASPCPAVHALCNEVVSALDHHRRPPGEEETARRLAMPLSDTERVLLARWGYPFVFESWQLHITLSDPLPEGQAPLQEAEAFFAPALALPRSLSSLGLFVERVPGQGFWLEERYPLGGC